MIEPVVDESSHKKALRRIEVLWGARPGSRDERELDALATLVDAYERRVFPIQAPEPAEAIQLRCEQMGWTRRELEPLIGSRARVSEVLTGRRALTLAMIRRLHHALHIPAEILIAEPARAAARAPKRRPVAREKRSRVRASGAAQLGVADKRRRSP